MTPSSLRRLKKQLEIIRPWLDPIAILLWAVLLLKYWLTGKLNILIHPNYFGLTVLGGVGLLIVSGLKLWQLYQVWMQSHRSAQRSAPAKSQEADLKSVEDAAIEAEGTTVATNPYAARLNQRIRAAQARNQPSNPQINSQNVQHVTLLPAGWSSILLITVAILGLLITPQTFGSHTALRRGLTETLPLTRLQPQAFQTSAKSEERSLIEWMRLLNVNPEPDTYKGQSAQVNGFVINPPDFPEGHFVLARFVITCCAADAYPIGLPVQFSADQAKRYPQDSWLEVKGKMITETINNERRLTIQAKSLTPIPEPRNPYDY